LPALNVRLLAAATGIALVGVLAAATDIEISGRWHGLFLLKGRSDAPLLLRDDLLLGDGSRRIAGVSFGGVRSLLESSPAAGVLPRLELDWSEASGRGRIMNRLADGTELVTFFGRYEDDDGLHPQGLFVGGALPEAAGASSSADANESGMSFRDARGWHHVWCNVNELLRDDDGEVNWPPGRWTFLGSRVLIGNSERVVLESAHAIPVEGGLLRITRYAYFRAGSPFFKLGVRVENSTERNVRFSYAYGDEPWVGHFGSSAGNIGFVPDSLVRVESPFDPTVLWAGILDEQSGIAAFLAWPKTGLPTLGYFGNDSGFDKSLLGRPLDSNSVFIGLEWLGVTLAPGEGHTIQLAIGMARSSAPGAVPSLPPRAVP
jgi:hypothetical protein